MNIHVAELSTYPANSANWITLEIHTICSPFTFHLFHLLFFSSSFFQGKLRSHANSLRGLQKETWFICKIIKGQWIWRIDRKKKKTIKCRLDCWLICMRMPLHEGKPEGKPEADASATCQTVKINIFACSGCLRSSAISQFDDAAQKLCKFIHAPHTQRKL